MPRSALTPDEEDRLLAACSKSRSRSLYPAACLALYTGLRRSELLSLTWGQVDLEKKTLTVGDSKTESGAGRLVPLNARATTALTFWSEIFPDREPQHAVFPSERVGAGTNAFTPCYTDTEVDSPVKSIKEGWERAKRQSKVHCRWHDLRHSFCTRLLEQGVSLPKVAAILGWSDSTTVRMAKRYGHIGEDSLRKAVETLDPKPAEPKDEKQEQQQPPAPCQREPSPTTVH